MEYIDVSWRQNNEDYPVRLVSEIDDNRYEIRKLEFFTDGRVGFASRTHRSAGTELGDQAVPPLTQINADPEFDGIAIIASEIESLWAMHFRAGT
jgi:hypothetical protein